jgi:hypothetical protein
MPKYSTLIVEFQVRKRAEFSADILVAFTVGLKYCYVLQTRAPSVCYAYVCV